MEILNNDDILKEEIINDAKTKADRILKKADREIIDIENNFKNEINNFESEINQNISNDINEQKRLIFASIDIEVKKEITKYSGELVNNIFKKIKDEIKNNKTIDYKKLMTNLIINQAEKINEEQFIIEISKNELEKLSKKDLNTIKLKKGKIISILETKLNEGFYLYSNDRKLMSFISLDNFINNLIEDERNNIYDILIKS